MFVESLESLCENHNVSFNVDSGCYSSLQILNLTKAIGDQLKYIILLKLAMLELPCCSKSCLIYPSTLLIHEFDYSWTQIKWIC